jgi:hypothetical protein
MHHNPSYSIQVRALGIILVTAVAFGALIYMAHQVVPSEIQVSRRPLGAKPYVPVVVSDTVRPITDGH